MPLDLIEAMKWMKLAADQGYVDAMYELGTAYRFGNCVSPDLIEASRLLFAATQQGDLGARAALMDIYDDLQLLAQQGNSGAHQQIKLLGRSKLIPVLKIGNRGNQLPEQSAYMMRIRKC